MPNEMLGPSNGCGFARLNPSNNYDNLYLLVNMAFYFILFSKQENNGMWRFVTKNK